MNLWIQLEVKFFMVEAQKSSAPLDANNNQFSGSWSRLYKLHVLMWRDHAGIHSRSSSALLTPAVRRSCTVLCSAAGGCWQPFQNTHPTLDYNLPTQPHLVFFNATIVIVIEIWVTAQACDLAPSLARLPGDRRRGGAQGPQSPASPATAANEAARKARIISQHTLPAAG